MDFIRQYEVVLLFYFYFFFSSLIGFFGLVWEQRKEGGIWQMEYLVFDIQKKNVLNI